MSRPWFLLLPLALFACGADTTMDLTQFDRSCAIAADCTLVFANVCGCSCEEVAIRASERDRYNTELAEKSNSCDPKIICAACVDERVVDCVDKVCTAR